MTKKKIGLATLFLLVLSAYLYWFANDGLNEELFISRNTFFMGSNTTLSNGKKDVMVLEDETPSHEHEQIGFFIDKFEVNNSQYENFLSATGYKSTLVDPIYSNAPYNWKEGRYPEGLGDNPVVLVTWDDADSYCKWAGKRLPSEMEWENACKGNRAIKWSFGNEFGIGKANTREAKLGSSGKIEAFPEDISPNGIVNLAGNVMEWTASDYMPYPGSKINQRRFDSTKKVIRGGGWVTDAQSARCSNRTVARVSKRHRALGFRCARDIR